MTLLWVRPLTLIAVLALLACVAGSAAAADAKIEVGKPAPDVELPATLIEKSLPAAKDAKTLRLKDLQGKKNVVLFFYPKAMTPGCTKESCGFRDLTEKFAKLDTVIIGISTDTVADQLKFTEKEKLNFTLFADADKSVTKTFGILGTRGVAMRETFVIDKKGVVRKIYTKVTPATHPEEVLKYVGETLAK